MTDQVDPEKTKWRSPNFDTYKPEITLNKNKINEVDNHEPEDATEDDRTKNDGTTAGGCITPPNQGDVPITPRKRLGGTQMKSKSTGKRKAAPATKKKPENYCRVCRVGFKTDEDQDVDSLWVGCAMENCDYWVHCKCTNIFYCNDNSGRKSLDAWSTNHYFCNNHMPSRSRILLYGSIQRYHMLVYGRHMVVYNHTTIW